MERKCIGRFCPVKEYCKTSKSTSDKFSVVDFSFAPGFKSANARESCAMFEKLKPDTMNKS